MPVNVEKLLASIPAAFHVSVLDTAGNPHDAVMVSASAEKGAKEYGFPEYGGDQIYVAGNFEAPQSIMQITRNGKTVKRRITGYTDYTLYVEFDIGETV